ncbi:MAG: nitroreductase family deazaflavin-dependent oxidoreductase [Anaerolineae bacterium]|nr:nitroreductase family deazaflavin-dependent oxidoreductase [Anaerolineae bacterium]
MNTVMRVLIGLPLLLLSLHTLARIVRAFYKFPIPSFLVGLIDNPLRRRIIQPPEDMPLRHGIQPGMSVLEIGPGSGTYTLAHARHIGLEGKLLTIDIEPKVIELVQQKIAAAGATNVEARVADVFALPFEDGTFDAVYAMSVIGEIPTPERALVEFHRVLKPGGTLAFSEILPDADYPLAGRLTRRVSHYGFRLRKKTGNFFRYTLVFEAVPVAEPFAVPLVREEYLPRRILKAIKQPPQLAYRLGLGPVIGRLVLLLTTTGRKSGLKRVTPLQYEVIDGAYYVASARGAKADWVRNIEADPRVEVRVKSRWFEGRAEVITEPGHIADFLQYRLERHPRLMQAMLRSEGMEAPPTRSQLEQLSAQKTLVILHPERELNQ